MDSCLPKSWMCDSEKHCYDGKDENDPKCPGACERNTTHPKYECKDGTCIDLKLRCNYDTVDCPDGSDEMFCGN